MNYKYHYDKLIQTRKLLNRKKLNKDNQNYAYYEKHHIIMSSMGGTDNKENLILLTAREHFLAHWLLWRIYRNKQTAYAFFRLCSYNNENGGKPILSSRVYEEAKIAAAVYSSEQFKNLWKNKEKRKKMSKENSIKNKGRKHSLESRKNMSISRTGMHQSKETIDKRVKAITGKKRSEEQKMRMKKAQSHRKETTEETKQKQSNSAKNRKKMDENIRLEMIRKMSLDKRKPRTKFQLISPDNKFFIFNGLKEVKNFSKTENISFTLLLKYKNKGKITSKLYKNKNSNNWEFKSIGKINYSI